MRWSVPTICSWIFESIAWQRCWDSIQIRIVAQRPLRARQRGVNWGFPRRNGSRTELVRLQRSAKVSQGAQSCLNSRSVTASDL